MNLANYIRDVDDFPIEGIVFKDITPLLQAPSAFQSAVDQMLEQAAPVDYDIIAAPDARGFIFGVPMALRAGVPFVPIRKPGKLPYSTVGYDYELEYGSDRLEMHVDAVPPGQRVLLVDDLLATGGTIRACGELIRKQGGVVAAYSFLIELGFLEGRSKLGDAQVNRVLSY
ncbi:MAG: adenine phosphoribosyltransferase [Pirellulaceae bacterium]